MSEPTAAPTAAPVAFSVGDKITATDGSNYIVFAYQAPYDSGNQFIAPAQGNMFAVADVQECAGPTADSANPFDWALRMPDNTRIASAAGFKEPALHATNLAPNDCVRGWVTFELPQGSKPAFIILTSSTNIRWTVP